MYTMNDFRMNTHAYSPIRAEGRRGYYSGKYEVNYSGILSTLIQEAGRYCEQFASDLFIDWRRVLQYIENPDIDTEISFLFGFRQFGVDHTEYVFGRYESEKDRARYNYRSMWRLDVSVFGDDINLTLGRVF